MVTGIRCTAAADTRGRSTRLQWGPVVVTGISRAGGRGHPYLADMLQWGPVVVTGISRVVADRG